MKEECTEGAQILKVDAKGRVRVSRERREALLAEYDRSSMTGAAFAEWSGIKYPTLMWWLGERRRAGKRSGAEAVVANTLSWVEAVVEENGTGRVGRQGGASPVPLEIVLSAGVSLRVNNREGAALAAEVLRQLGGSLRPC